MARKPTTLREPRILLQLGTAHATCPRSPAARSAVIRRRHRPFAARERARQKGGGATSRRENKRERLVLCGRRRRSPRVDRGRPMEPRASRHPSQAPAAGPRSRSRRPDRLPLLFPGRICPVVGPAGASGGLAHRAATDLSDWRQAHLGRQPRGKCILPFSRAQTGGADRADRKRRAPAACCGRAPTSSGGSRACTPARFSTIAAASRRRISSSKASGRGSARSTTRCPGSSRPILCKSPRRADQADPLMPLSYNFARHRPLARAMTADFDALSACHFVRFQVCVLQIRPPSAQPLRSSELAPVSVIDPV